MPARNVEQAKRCAGRPAPPPLPTRGGHGRNIHHRGEDRLADVQFSPDGSHLRRRQRLHWRRQQPRGRAKRELLLARQMIRERLDIADQIGGVKLNVLGFHV